MDLGSFDIFNAFIERATDPLVVLDAGGTVRLLNSSAERALGWSSAAVRGKRLGELCLLEGEELQPLAAEEPRSRRFSCEIRCSEGRRLWARFFAEPIGSSEGLLLAVEAVSSIGACAHEEGDVLDYEISTAAQSFGELMQVARLGMATFRAEGGMRCFEEFFDRKDPCDECPVLRSASEGWPRSVARRRNGNAIEVATAELVGPSRARVRLRSLGDRELRATHELRVSELSTRAALSPSEENVFRLLVQGDSPVVIADALGVTERTVKFHQTNLLRKLGVDSRFDLLRLLA